MTQTVGDEAGAGGAGVLLRLYTTVTTIAYGADTGHSSAVLTYCTAGGLLTFQCIIQSHILLVISSL